MKYLFLLCVLSFQAFISQGQLKLPISSAFRSDIQELVKDYPGGFTQTKGEARAKNPQTIEYVSLISPEGVSDAYVMQYSSLGKSIYSWHGVLLETEDFEEASKKYKWLFTQLKGMNVTYVADQYTLEGKYVTPDESIGFAISTLTLANPPSPLKKMKIEVSLNFEFPEWKVGLSIFEKEREDDERGNPIEQ